MLRIALATGLVMLVSTPCLASSGSLDQSSSASASVSVYIPPISAALRASAQGAVGLWSITGQFNGIMIDLGETQDGLFDSVEVFTRTTTGYELQWDLAATSNPVIASNDKGGLAQSLFRVPAGSPPVATFTIRAI